MFPDFGSPTGALLGVMTAAFSIGAVIAVPFVPFVNDRFGRKACVVIGSVIISIGAILQTAAVDSAYLRSKLQGSLR
jgi:MFS family permease